MIRIKYLERVFARETRVKYIYKGCIPTYIVQRVTIAVSSVNFNLQAKPVRKKKKKKKISVEQTVRNTKNEIKQKNFF